MYVNIDHEKATLRTPIEAGELSAHPSGNLLEPALSFPFTVGKLKKNLVFASREGWDFPLLKDKFIALVHEKKSVATHLIECPDENYIGTNKIDKNRTNRKNHLIKTARTIWESDPENNFRVSEMANMLLEDLKLKK